MKFTRSSLLTKLLITLLAIAAAISLVSLHRQLSQKKLEKAELEREAAIAHEENQRLQDAIDAGADAFLTGEANHHAGHDAIQAGIGLVVAGHFATEFPVAAALAEQLEERFPELEVLVSQWDHDPFNNMEP